MPDWYAGHLDALIRSKCGNQSYIRPAGPTNDQNEVLMAIL